LKLPNALDRYPSYFVIGSSIAAATIGLREVLGRAWGEQNPIVFNLSMVTAYGAGIIVSYVLQRRFTFKKLAQNPWLERVKYLGTALLGMGLTIIFANGIKWGLDFIPLLIELHRTLAFGSAALLTSFVTYFVNKRFTFR